jgi:hypothetical protein
MFRSASRPNLAFGLLDLVLLPLLLLAAGPMKLARQAGMGRLPLSRELLRRLGVFPIRDHYYEPLFVTRTLGDLRRPRPLPGLDFRPEAQAALLARFTDVELLRQLPRAPAGEGFHYDNRSYVSPDAELWFHMVKTLKPARIVEIGSGHSTRMARVAIARLTAEDPAYACRHICIEPYEAPWLERTGAEILRQRVEEVDPGLFEALGADDILFIDSSHIIRPQGDVLHEYLDILPRLAPGVVVHVHDIFTPRDYLDRWLHADMLFWNEQYVLEACLSANPSWEILLASSMMVHERPDLIAAACPMWRPGLDAASFYFRRTRSSRT